MNGSAPRRKAVCLLLLAGIALWPSLEVPAQPAHAEASGTIGRELAVPRHLENGEEFRLSVHTLIAFGRRLFTARWTSQDGQGRPLAKGTGEQLADPGSPLVFPRRFNHVSGPDTGACSRCHNRPAIGGGGDSASNLLVLAQRLDFATFDAGDGLRTRGALDERGMPVTLQSVGNLRKTVGMFGSGFIEMLARQMTAELQARAAACRAGRRCALRAKGVDFGTLTRRADGTWDISQVMGLPAQSLDTSGSAPPSLVIHPFHQSGSSVSLRDFTNGAFNHHHGMQSEERFGAGVDHDGDGVVNELTRADITAVALFQATLAVPGQVIPRDARFGAAIAAGERQFQRVGCAGCHIPRLPLTEKGWVYSEPNPYNPAGNLRLGDGVEPVSVDLTRADLPRPRLRVDKGVVMVPAYTDLKLHDITNGLPSCAAHPELIDTHQCEGDAEPLDQNEPAGTPAFFAGNRRFITRKLWGIANQHAFGHHGQYTTLREAVLAHAGEAAQSSAAFRRLAAEEQDALIEFLKSLQILPPGTPCLVVDENYRCWEE